MSGLNKATAVASSSDADGRVYSSGIGSLVRTIQSNKLGSIFTGYAVFQEQQAAGTNGGTFTSGGWVTRTLNTEVVDRGGIATLSANKITLQPGTYYIEGSAHAYNCSSNKLKVQNTTTDTTLIEGQSNFANNPGAQHSMALLEGTVVLSGINEIALQHRCAVTVATFGLGVSNSLGTEVYSQVKIYKENV